MRNRKAKLNAVYNLCKTKDYCVSPEEGGCGGGYKKKKKKIQRKYEYLFKKNKTIS